MHGLRLALSFLTALPVPAAPPRPGDLGRAAAWFPTVGLLVGVVLAAAQFLLGQLFPGLLTAALVVAAWAALTGGLHLDGLADCCDALPAPVAPERRLEILRDPRLGAFGATGLALFLIVKTLAVASLLPDRPAAPWDGAGLALLFAAALARWVVLPVARQPAARQGGMGPDFALGLTPATFALAAILPLALVVVGGWRALAAAALAHVATLAVIVVARSRLGGVTGDVFGLTVELAEVTVLLAFAARVVS